MKDVRYARPVGILNVGDRMAQWMEYYGRDYLGIKPFRIGLSGLGYWHYEYAKITDDERPRWRRDITYEITTDNEWTEIDMKIISDEEYTIPW